MADAVRWPAGVPRANALGQSAQQAVGAAQRVEMDVGTPRSIARHDHALATMQFEVEMTGVQAESWLAWWAGSTMFGVVEVLLPLAGECWGGETLWGARILTTKWQAARGNRWKLSATALLLREYPVLLLDLDTSTSSAADQSPYHHALTAYAQSSVVASAGRLGGGAIYQPPTASLQSRVETGAVVQLAAWSSLTIEAWAYPEVDTDAYMHLVQVGGALDNRINIGIANGVPRAYSGATATADFAVPLNAWLHVAGVLDADASELRLYVNGSMVSRVAASPLAATPAASIAIGSQPFWFLPDDQFLGRIEGVRVRSTAAYHTNFTPT